jgi:diacylglycerol kinase
VISLELLNTAIEGIVDLISPERQVKAGRVKDIAAAAVLFSAILSGSIGVVIFANYLL